MALKMKDDEDSKWQQEIADRMAEDQSAFGNHRTDFENFKTYTRKSVSEMTTKEEHAVEMKDLFEVINHQLFLCKQDTVNKCKAMEKTIKEELSIPDVCGTPYDKYDTFKDCIQSFDSKLTGNGQQLFQLESFRKAISQEIKDLEKELKDFVHEATVAAKKNQIAILLQKEFQEKLHG